MQQGSSVFFVYIRRQSSPSQWKKFSENWLPIGRLSLLWFPGRSRHKDYSRCNRLLDSYVHASSIRIPPFHLILSYQGLDFLAVSVLSCKVCLKENRSHKRWNSLQSYYHKNVDLESVSFSCLNSLFYCLFFHLHYTKYSYGISDLHFYFKCSNTNNPQSVFFFMPFKNIGGSQLSSYQQAVHPILYFPIN